ncbi:response regulator [Mucilaginibacter sp. BJC16-A38]|uniref:response regulator n=1 Tax=Mucilaginibacter phenanthrenivorans TaxID=1234842 RepID=UPI002158595E|nr:response regulator [Mucilaginibacter phenanthrenivorans]MCR8557797.1 response regulator [Mucilaginibacter phenanthrenivorans]
MRKSILVVEEDKVIRENISERLTLEGYDVIKADNGDKAIQLANEKLPNLVICELNLEGLSCYDVFLSLFSKLFANQIPFIYFMTIYRDKSQEKVEYVSLENYLENRFYDPNLFVCVKNCLAFTR